jgi:ribosomal protein S18 acetylase RimI-like enzyme
MEVQQLNIFFTEDAEIIQACASMMSTSDPWITLGIDYENCLAAFGGPCKEIYAAYYENNLAGFVILQTCGSFKGYIQTLCVAANYRGQGFGGKILAFCEKRILQISPNIFICVSSFNTGAIKLYSQFGFSLVGELPDFVKAGFPELLMRKSVGPIMGYQPHGSADQP